MKRATRQFMRARRAPLQRPLPACILIRQREYRRQNGHGDVRVGDDALTRRIRSGFAHQLLVKLATGKVSQSDITLVEGWTFQQFRSRMDVHPELIHDSRGLSDAEIIERLGLPWKNLEGLEYGDLPARGRQPGCSDAAGDAGTDDNGAALGRRLMAINVDLNGKEAVVIGRSNIVGKPMEIGRAHV